MSLSYHTLRYPDVFNYPHYPLRRYRAGYRFNRYIRYISTVYSTVQYRAFLAPIYNYVWDKCTVYFYNFLIMKKKTEKSFSLETPLS